ncbi:uncharacterized protein LOC136082692 [Hydra vulgaris]|uniref:uncharacterized protein LOC136082692 n=1 Tax=Hydra vulgaris TaxID=6087 RepID=UPI0032EA224E
MPEPNTMIVFTNYNRSMRVPFVVYADFESIITPINTCTPNPNESYTKQYQRHIPSLFCYYIKCFDESVYETIEKTIGHSILGTFTADSEDDDVAQIFVDNLNRDKENFNNAKICHNCEKDLEEDKVKDHFLITGKYRGAAHNECNLNYKIPNFIPVFFHNLSGYDSHLLIKKLSRNAKSEEKINCIPNNDEKYISFSKQIKVAEYTNKKGKKVEIKKELRFIDSYKFMDSSLDELVKNSIKVNYKELSNKKLNLLLRKGVYPYEWIDSISKLNETQLPPKESFYSRLNDEEISDEDYSHAQTVWKEFDSPGLAWDAALKETKVKLELLNDYDMILMIKHGLRGGISMISNSKESTYIQYLDANNLYGWAMNKPLPTHGFKWMNEEELKNWKSISCILEVGLGYPEELHDLSYEEHNDYLLAPERGIKFEESAWLSKYIKLNTDLRTKATNEFEKDFFKLMINSVFGKTMKNIENRVDYEDRAKLLYTDTDSLIYEIKTKDFYADIANDIECKFDTSEFDKNHLAVRNGFKVSINKKVLGMFKDESAGKQIAEFIGLRSKLYSYKIDGEDKKRCKGVKKNVVKNYITHEDYKDCLMNRKDQMRKMNVIRSHCHEVYTEEINKIALSAEDDKRVVLEDGIHTLAYGHYKFK